MKKAKIKDIMRGGVTDRGRSSIERKKSICAKGWRIESGNNLVTL